MALISELKTATDSQFGAALKLTEVARDLNGIRRELEERGDDLHAERLLNAIRRLLNESDELTRSARQSGKGVVDALKSNW
jgi:molecular chaperone GrpE (heat shock protein)